MKQRDEVIGRGRRLPEVRVIAKRRSDELPKRAGLRYLLTHGSADSVCPVEVSRSLARLLDEAHMPVRYVEFDGPHTVSLEAANALVAFVTDP